MTSAVTRIFKRNVYLILFLLVAKYRMLRPASVLGHHSLNEQYEWPKCICRLGSMPSDSVAFETIWTEILADILAESDRVFRRELIAKLTALTNELNVHNRVQSKWIRGLKHELEWHLSWRNRFLIISDTKSWKFDTAALAARKDGSGW